MTNHQFTDGQLVEYLNESVPKSKSIATIINIVSDNTYQIRLKATGEKETVGEDEIKELD